MITSRNVIMGVLIYVFAFLLFLAGAHAQQEQATAPAMEQSAAPATQAAPGVQAAPAAAASPTPVAASPTPKAKKKKRFNKIYAKFETNMGTFKARLFHAYAPKTVANFVALAEGEKEWMDIKTQNLVKTPFYDGLIFHRVIKGFVIQGGDPWALDPKRAGNGGPGYDLEGEFHPDLKFDRPGILAMAKGTQISGSQFFITLSPQPKLDNPKNYPIFGEIVEGMDVVEKIGNVPTDRRNGDRPLEAVVMKKVTIIRE